MTSEREIEKRPWCCGARTFFCGARTLIMGVLNVTPDSFSDGGHFSDTGPALRHARAMIDAGVDIIDIGGESSRPGADAVTLDEERRRVLPVVEGIRAVSDVPISVDTTKAELARQAIGRGADIINDITALRGDSEMPHVAAETGVGLILMHMRGTPKTMQDDPFYEDPVGEVEAFFRERIDAAVAAGIATDHLCIDPGIGFGKRVEDNLALIAAGWRLGRLGFLVLLGVSRKSFLGALLDLPVEERLEGSLAAGVAGVLCGADILRVHDVRETRRAAAVADALKGFADG